VADMGLPRQCRSLASGGDKLEPHSASIMTQRLINTLYPLRFISLRKALFRPFDTPGIACKKDEVSTLFK
jgi:hypothetical protein